MGIELEYKLAVDSAQKLEEILASPLVTALRTEPYRTYRMATTYFDTAGCFLSNRRWTLRLREENDQRVATCKTPAGDRARGEWNCEAPDLATALPMLVADGAPEELLTLSEFLPICGARFTRQAADLQLPGAVCEISSDAGILTGGTRTAPICELELELKSGSEEALAAFVAQVMAAFNLQELHKSKFARAKALREEET